MIRNASIMMHVLGSDNLVYTITYPSSLTNQSLLITTTNNDTVTTSNGVSVREVAINKYNFTLNGNTGYTPGHLIINGVEQSGSSVSNYVIAGNVVLSATEASYTGVYYTHSWLSGGTGPFGTYFLTTHNAITGKNISTSGIWENDSPVNISLPVNSTYSIHFVLDSSLTDYTFDPNGELLLYTSDTFNETITNNHYDVIPTYTYIDVL